MKAKKIHITRPEIEVKFERPILGRLQFFKFIPKLYTIKKVKVSGIFSKKDAVFEKTLYVVTIPKIRKEGVK